MNEKSIGIVCEYHDCDACIFGVNGKCAIQQGTATKEMYEAADAFAAAHTGPIHH